MKVFSSTHPIHGGTLSGQFNRHTLHSKHLNEERGLTVRLPDSYDPQKKYPVVYLQDGQNMFDRRTGFMGSEWGADETFAELTRQGKLPETILVAVDNGGGKRLDEYTHVKDPNYGGGQGSRFENFFLEEVLPAVESSYSVDSQKRVMIGSSLGGLVSLQMGLNNPTVFAAIGALSPSVWWADGTLASETLKKAETGEAKPRIWLDMGTEEGKSDEFGQRSIEGKQFSERPVGSNGLQDVRDRTREMGEALLSKGWTLDSDLRYHEPLGAQHTESSWAARLGEVAQWLIPT